MTLETPPSAPAQRSFFQFMLEAAGSAAGFVWRYLWQILCLLLIGAFTCFVIDPFASPPDPRAQDIAEAWTNSIEKLGILAIFPPEEDFYVGDIWAVVDDVDSSTPLLGRAVRLDHIDLRPEILDTIRGQTVRFGETMDIKAGDKFRRQDPSEVAVAHDKEISLTLAAFPGITINHSLRAESALMGGLAAFGASRQDHTTEVLRIPIAETYGASAAAAYDRLAVWCSDKATMSRCTDKYARNLLAFSVDLGVNTMRDGKYVNAIQLRLITRVFLTREIQQGNRQTSSTAISGNASAQPRDGTSTPAVTEGANVKADARAADAPAGARGDNLSLSHGDGVNIGLRETFQRPVAFGYRAITFVLTP